MKTINTTAAMIEEINDRIETTRTRSAWDRGVQAYAMDLTENLDYMFADDFAAPRIVRRALLNGASDWKQYSWGGSSLCYDRDIARRLFNPSELKKTQDGARRPNSREEWLDTQARALYQAAAMVERIVSEIVAEMAAAEAAEETAI